MILRRLGNKSKIAKEIQRHFPRHKTYIEPFFGAGGMFFNKPTAQHNIVNDQDSDVVNLFKCVVDRKDELLAMLKITPIHQGLLNYWNKKKEDEPIRRAIRFLTLSNFGYMGKAQTLSLMRSNSKQVIYNRIDKVFDKMQHVLFCDKDFQSFLEGISFRRDKQIDNAFVYSDPPYLNTSNNYEKGFTENDVVRLFDVLQSRNWKFAVSEFNQPFILEQAKQRGLNVITIGERKNLKNRRTEVLITNYKKQKTLFDA